MNHAAKVKMTVEQFLAWGEAQSEGRYELVDGEIVMMAPERAIHNRVKYFVARALDDAIVEAGVAGTVYTDGVGIRIHQWKLREPDASIQLGDQPANDKMELDNPFLVVEVTSPSSVNTDETDKLEEYASIKSIKHYLVVAPDHVSVIHYRRVAPGKFETTIVNSGTISFDPPGFTVDVADFYAVKRKSKR